MMLTYHSLRASGDDTLVEDLNRRFNATRAARDWDEPAYRTCFLLSKTRTQAELEELAASLRGQPPQSVQADSILPLCQLWLQITHHGRVVLDKDRHIRNLESALASADQDRRVLEALRLEVVELKRLVKDSTAVFEALPKDAAASRQVLRDAAAAMNASLERARSDMERTDLRLADLARVADSASRHVSEVLNSRIWRSLQAVGKVALKLGQIYQRKNELQLICDEPSAEDVTQRSGTIVVRGWALAPSGIGRVEVQVDDGPLGLAQLGESRPDVAKAFPKITGASRPGYHFALDSTPLANGVHTIRVRATSGAGAVRTVHRQIVIDHDKAFASGYDRWIAEFERPEEAAIRLKLAGLSLGPLISVMMPVFRTDATLLARAVASVLAQSFPNWELCVADDHSESAALAAILERHAAREPRIKVTALPAHGGISAASNAALALAAGEYVALLDHDDELAPDALLGVAAAIGRAPDADVLYSDEDKIDSEGRRFDPFFKPDWSPDLLLSENYVCHLLVARRELVSQAGGFRSEYDGSQDYDLVLRLAQRARRIVHIPSVLYHWRTAASSTALASGRKPHSNDAARRAIEDHLKAVGVAARVEQGCAPGRFRVHYAIAENTPVSILIPSGGNLDALRKNLKSLADKTDYNPYEIVVIDNSKGNNIERFVRQSKHRKPVRYLDFRGEPFNYSKLNNAAARQSNSPLLLFLNDDTEVIAPGWLTAMVELAVRPEVGAVGAKLLYPNGRIQHAGVIMGVFANCGHAFKGLDGQAQHYFDFPDVIRDVSAVTGACLMTRRERLLGGRRL